MQGIATLRGGSAARPVAIALIAALAALALAATASAKTVELHRYNGTYPAGSFDAADANGGTAPFPSGLHDMSIFQETGQVFAGDAGSNRVYKFSAEGISEPFADLAPATTLNQSINNFGDVVVDNYVHKGRIYAFPENGPVRAYEPGGTAAENFPINVSGACGGDVAPDGSLWVASWNSSSVKQFNSETGVATGTEFSTPSPCDLAIDSQGNFYTVQESAGTVRKYNSSRVLQGVFDSDEGGEPELAIDPSNDDVYVDHRSFINHYSKDGGLISKFGQPEAGSGYPGLQSSRGIAVRASNHMVYAMNEINGHPRIDTFAPTGPIVIADATTEAAGGLTRTTATLHGTLNPDNVTTTNCKFEYGPSNNPYSSTAPCAEGNVFSGSSDSAVSASLSGLTSGATYHFRLVVTNANGESNGADLTFTAISAVKDTVTEPATNVTRTSATLHGSFDADGFETSYWFEWGNFNFENKVPVPAPPGENVGTPVGTFPVSQSISGLTQATTYQFRLVAVNSLGETRGATEYFTTVRAVKDLTTLPATEVSYESATLNGSFDRDNKATSYWFEYGKFNYDHKVPLPAPPGATVPAAPGVIEVSQHVTGLETGTNYYFRITAQNELGQTTAQQELQVQTLVAVKSVSTNPATEVHLTSATLHGQLDPDGIPTTYYFEYGTSTIYGSYAPASPPGSDAGETPGVQEFSSVATGLEPGVEYHYRMVGENVHGRSVGNDQMFNTNDKPTILNDTVTQVNTDGAVLVAEINANALETSYHFEYGPEPCSTSSCTAGPSQSLFDNTVPKPVSFQQSGLTPGQTVYFRLIAINSRGTTVGEDRHFTTYVPDSGADPCTNSQVRQQTTAALLLDCRGYELVSAANAGGYDVESDLVAGQKPLVAYPDAQDRLLYSMHQGSIPGIAGNPTNFGRDPYVATRGEHSWTTRYVGLPANGMTQVGAFGSPLLGSDSSLSVFAFGGPSICDPCFGDGSTNIPLRLADGSLVKGMAGTLNPAADPSQKVAKPLSADGVHLIFGSNQQFESAGDPAGSIYDRNLVTSKTQVVSTMPAGTPISGGGVGELDVSSDGSRIVVGKKISTDAAGNDYWHPYMHIGSSANSVDLAPGTTTGVLFAGMTSDGSKVFFTTSDKLVGSDTDESPDLYEADVSGGGPAVLTRLSTGSTPPVGNSDGCDPAPNSDGNNWNAVGSSSTDGCGVVAIAGGGGVGSSDGTVYFFSPELLDGSGSSGEPNLYVVRPGQPPHFVATVEPDDVAVRNGVANSEVHSYGDFQVTPDGAFAVFNSNLSLTSFNSLGHTEIYRYDADGEALDCASCAPSGAAPITDTSLPGYGLAVTDDGRVFFTSAQSFVLRDTNEKKDAYEYSGGVVQLISTGSSLEDSGMLSVTSNGKDAFFFTRQVLVHEDGNGSTVKIYDAREHGGFLFDPPPQPCRASDECHGAGSQVPGPPNINTYTGAGVHSEASAGTPAPCKKGFVSRKGKCVKRKPKKHGHRGKHRGRR